MIQDKMRTYLLTFDLSAKTETSEIRDYSKIEKILGKLSFEYERILTTTWLFRSHIGINHLSSSLSKSMGEDCSLIVTEVARYTYAQGLSKDASSILKESVLDDKSMLTIKLSKN
jgi:hypothetical protein